VIDNVDLSGMDEVYGDERRGQPQYELSRSVIYKPQMTFEMAAVQRMYAFLRKTGHWNIAEGFRDAIEMATALQAQRNAGKSLSADEEALVQLMRAFQAHVAEHFGGKIG
jgi:hypothetical protein